MFDTVRVSGPGVSLGGVVHLFADPQPVAQGRPGEECSASLVDRRLILAPYAVLGQQARVSTTGRKAGRLCTGRQKPRQSSWSVFRVSRQSQFSTTPDDAVRRNTPNRKGLWFRG